MKIWFSTTHKSAPLPKQIYFGFTDGNPLDSFQFSGGSQHRVVPSPTSSFTAYLRFQTELQTDVKNQKKRKKKSKSKQIDDEDDLELDEDEKTSEKKEMKKLRKSFKEMTQTMKNLHDFFTSNATDSTRFTFFRKIQVLRHMLYLMRMSEKPIQRRVALAHLYSPEDQRTICIDDKGLEYLLSLLCSRNTK